MARRCSCATHDNGPCGAWTDEALRACRAANRSSDIGPVFAHASDLANPASPGPAIRDVGGDEQTITEIAERVGVQYVKRVHVNDSRHARGCRKDRHEHIAHGHIG